MYKTYDTTRRNFNCDVVACDTQTTILSYATGHLLQYVQSGHLKFQPKNDVMFVYPMRFANYCDENVDEINKLLLDTLQ